MKTNNAEKRYVVVIKNRCLALGPFDSADAVEYALMDYYGTAITGASAQDEYLIAELHQVDPEALVRQHDAHVAALLTYDD